MDETVSTFTYQLNQQLAEDERIFKLSEAAINRNDTLIITLLVSAKDYDKFLNDSLMQKINDIISNMLPQDTVFTIVYKKTYTDNKEVTRSFWDILASISPFLVQKISESSVNVEISYNSIKLQILLERDIYSFINSGKILNDLTDRLDSLFMESIEIEALPIDRVRGESKKEVKLTSSTSINNAIRYIAIEKAQDIIGKVLGLPRYISDIIKKEQLTVTLTGKVLGYKELVAKSSGKIFFTLNLDDTTGIVKCKYFPKKDKDIENFRKITDKSLICVEGPLRYDDFAKENTLTIYKCCFSEINFGSIINLVEYKKVPEAYSVIFPEPYKDYEEKQVNFFDEAESKPINISGQFVVFDLETTGLQPTECKIIEIAGVKIVDGVIVETFSTFVNPQIAIPYNITQLTHITDEDVKNAPLFEEIIGDFYKFAYGCSLVAHNISFDIGFLTYHAKNSNYNFSNDTIDTLSLARQQLKTKNHKLDTVCQALGVQLNNAHRAVGDALATAKVFKLLFRG